jgi:hypothetical protein
MCTTRGSHAFQGPRFVKYLNASPLDPQVSLRREVAPTAKSISAIRASMCALNDSLVDNVGSTSIIAQNGSSCNGVPLVVRILDLAFSIQERCLKAIHTLLRLLLNGRWQQRDDPLHDGIEGKMSTPESTQRLLNDFTAELSCDSDRKEARLTYSILTSVE